MLESNNPRATSACITQTHILKTLNVCVCVCPRSVHSACSWYERERISSFRNVHKDLACFLLPSERVSFLLSFVMWHDVVGSVGSDEQGKLIRIGQMLSDEHPHVLCSLNLVSCRKFSVQDSQHARPVECSPEVLACCVCYSRSATCLVVVSLFSTFP
jgi:hypothetical protein